MSTLPTEFNCNVYLMPQNQQPNPLEARQAAVCSDYGCAFNTDCYAQRCGNCINQVNGIGNCDCPPEGCAGIQFFTDMERVAMIRAYVDSLTESEMAKLNFVE
jgi:hypothetical protein